MLINLCFVAFLTFEMREISLLSQVAFKTFATKKSNYSSCWTCEEYHYFRKSRHHLGCSSSPYIYCHNRFNEITDFLPETMCTLSENPPNTQQIKGLAKFSAWKGFNERQNEWNNLPLVLLRCDKQSDFDLKWTTVSFTCTMKTKHTPGSCRLPRQHCSIWITHFQMFTINLSCFGNGLILLREVFGQVNFYYYCCYHHLLIYLFLQHWGSLIW